MNQWIFRSCGILTAILAICPAATEPENPPAKESAPPAATAPTPTEIKPAGAMTEEEQRLADTLIRDFPKRGESLMLLGNLYRRRGNSAKAVECWNQALAVDPSLAPVYQSLGALAFEKDDYPIAAEMWEKALNLKPSLPAIRNQLGDALMRLGRNDEAIQVLEEELKWNPDSAVTHYFLGRCHLQLQHLDKARQYYEKTIALEPKHTNAYYGLSTLCARMKEPEKSREYLERFRECKARDDQNQAKKDRLDYDSTSARAGILEMIHTAAVLYITNSQTEKAETLLKRGLELDPGDIGCLERLAMMYQSQGRLLDSLTVLLRNRDLRPNNPLCHLNLGSVYSQLKQFDNAESAYRKVVDLLPKSSKGYYELARLYLRTGRKFSDALGLAQEAVRLEPTAENYWILSWALDATGDRLAAIQAIDQAVRMSPDNAKYKQIRNQLTGRTP